MIVGLGLDIIEIQRLRAAIDRHEERFVERVFTAAECGAANARRRSRIEFLAGRWAGKEAVAKALGCGFGAGCGWQDVEILNDEYGKPTVELTGNAQLTAKRLGIASLMMTISHEVHYAVAVALAET